MNLYRRYKFVPRMKNHSRYKFLFEKKLYLFKKFKKFTVGRASSLDVSSKSAMLGAPRRASSECADERGAGCADERGGCADERRADGHRAGCADERGAVRANAARTSVKRAARTSELEHE